MKQKIIIGLIILTLFLTGCSVTAKVMDDSQAAPAGINQVAAANNQFAFEMYSELSNNENVFFSPYSISSAMSMVYEGARSQTAEEIQSVFHFPADDITRRSSYASLYNEINKKDKEYKLNTANALWAQQDYPFLQNYLDIINQYYGGETTNLDFITQPEQSRQIINNWVEEQTNNKIKNIIPQGAINDMTRMILTNAVYFKGEWIWKFKKRDTKERDFYIAPETHVKVDMMFLDSDKPRLNYMENELLQMIELPYQGEELSMLILLPINKTTHYLEQNLTLGNFNSWKSEMRERSIPVYIPKFTFETEYSMSSTLSDMGMPAAFKWPGADFSGMDGTDLLYIDKVIHKAFVEVNEKGTEAAAATAVMMAMASAEPMEIFNADHPFIFLIQQKETGNILFMGKVMDPR